MVCAFSISRLSEGKIFNIICDVREKKVLEREEKGGREGGERGVRCMTNVNENTNLNNNEKTFKLLKRRPIVKLREK